MPRRKAADCKLLSGGGVGLTREIVEESIVNVALGVVAGGVDVPHVGQRLDGAVGDVGAERQKIAEYAPVRSVDSNAVEGVLRGAVLKVEVLHRFGDFTGYKIQLRVKHIQRCAVRAFGIPNHVNLFVVRVSGGFNKGKGKDEMCRGSLQNISRIVKYVEGGKS